MPAIVLRRIQWRTTYFLSLKYRVSNLNIARRKTIFWWWQTLLSARKNSLFSAKRFDSRSSLAFEHACMCHYFFNLTKSWGWRYTLTKVAKTFWSFSWYPAHILVLNSRFELVTCLRNKRYVCSHRVQAFRAFWSAIFASVFSFFSPP